jgi:hypothetical protein
MIKKILCFSFFITLGLLLSSCALLSENDEVTVIDYDSIESDIKSNVLEGIVIVNEHVFGFIVNKSGKNYTVISGYNSKGNKTSHTIEDFNGIVYTAELVKTSEKSYLAMYKFSSDSTDLKVLQLTHSLPEVTRDILTIGSNNAVKFGTASEQKFNTSLNATLFSHNAQSSSLNGSAMVFDFSGLVVGIEVGAGSIATNGRTTRFGVHASKIRDFL